MSGSEWRAAVMRPSWAPVGELLGGLAAPARAQDPTTTGSITALNGTVVVSLANVPAATIQITGTWSGAAFFEASNDGGVTWWPWKVVAASGGSIQAVTMTNGLF